MAKFALLLALLLPAAAHAQHAGHTPTTQPATEPATLPVERTYDAPPLPPGRTLDEVLDYGLNPPPESFGPPVADNELFSFTLIELLEYRVPDDGRDQLGYDAQAWIGYDYDKLWLKSEGAFTLDGPDEGEATLDALYSRLVTPFWNAQVGVQYAADYDTDNYDDTFSGVVALQGLAPGNFEIDASLFLSEDADVTATLLGSYDVYVTQRLVLQPRAEIGLSAQDVPNRGLGAGLTDTALGLRLRYQFEREFAPYVGVHYEFQSGETRNFTDAAGDDGEILFFVAGFRLAF